MKRFFIGLIACAAASGAAASTLDGVYSEPQAARGPQAYALNCAQCHGADLAGTFEVPNLRGYLIGRWTGASLGKLYGYIGSAMPLHAPGALSPEAYADIVAYMLKVNGLPAGARELPADASALQGIVIRGPAVPP